MNHLGRLAANVRQVQASLDTSDIQFRVPAEAIQLRDVLFGVQIDVDECCDDIDRFRPTTTLDNVVADLAEFQRLGNPSVSDRAEIT